MDLEIELVTCVYVGVFLHVGLLVEPLAAVGAGVWAGVTVDQEVRREGGGALEALPTLLALKAPLLGVDHPVLVQTDGMPKSLVTDLTRIRP